MLGSSPVLTVSDFVAVFNQSLDMMYPEVVVTGELANFRISKNMWTYFDLKDELASVKFFGSVRSLPGPLEEGMMLEVVARPFLHPQFGFSLQVQAVQVAGTGSIRKAYDLLKKQLEKEGLFAPERKRPLPEVPGKIGLITSSESAAYGDFTKILTKRWPMTEVVLYDVVVQGVSAPESLVKAIAASNERADIDVLVMIRGGGSKDDLACFDHETVVRAVAASRIPMMVAVGHERDVALSELAADMRASTPSNAAELLVPDQAHEKAILAEKAVFLDNILQKYTTELDTKVAQFAELLDAIFDQQIAEEQNYIGQTKTLMVALDPHLPLARGYVLSRDKAGNLLRTAKSAKSAGEFELEFMDGHVPVKVRS